MCSSNYENNNNITRGHALTVPSNKERTLYVSCGVPGSGKTTFLRNHIKKDEIIISRDDIRFALLKEGEEYFSHEDKVFNMFIDMIISNLRDGKNVYADATHLNRASRSKLLKTIATKAPDLTFNTESIFFDVPVDICLLRNENRKGTKAYVPRGVIRRMSLCIEKPDKTKEKFLKSWSVDKDGICSKVF